MSDGDRTRRRGRHQAERDQSASAFSAALTELCESVPARAAALVDSEGETVDYAGGLTPFEIRVAAAEWRLVLAQVRRSTRLIDGNIDRMYLRCQLASYCILSLSEGYAVIICLAHGAFTGSERAFCQAVRDLSVEAGLAVPSGYQGQRWLRVSVRESEGAVHRPATIRYGEEWVSLEVIGRYLGAELRPREIGFRVRLANGLETTLIRERLGRWFSDHLGFERETAL